MATTTTGHPGRTLIVLAVLVAGLITLMAVSGTWVPKLGLDLQGGTTITLTAQNTSGTGTVDPNSLQQAKTIIQNRVDSLGVGESEVTTAGDKQLIVTVPNVQRDELVQLVGQTAVLRFRAVLAAEQVAPPVPEPVPTETGSPAPSEEPTGSASAEPTPPTAGIPSDDASAVPQPTPAQSGNNRPFPALPTAPPQPAGEACLSADGQGIPPDQAMEWQPNETCQAAFAEFTCDQKLPDVSDQPLFACDREGTEKYLLGPTLIEGDQLDQRHGGNPAEQRQLGGRTWSSTPRARSRSRTPPGSCRPRRDPQNRFAIVLDGESISAPSVSAPIPGGRARDHRQLHPEDRDRSGQRVEVRRPAAGLRGVGGEQRLGHPRW